MCILLGIRRIQPISHHRLHICIGSLVTLTHRYPSILRAGALTPRNPQLIRYSIPLALCPRYLTIYLIHPTTPHCPVINLPHHRIALLLACLRIFQIPTNHDRVHLIIDRLLLRLTLLSRPVALCRKSRIPLAIHSAAVRQIFLFRQSGRRIDTHASGHRRRHIHRIDTPATVRPHSRLDIMATKSHNVTHSLLATSHSAAHPVDIGLIAYRLGKLIIIVRQTASVSPQSIIQLATVGLLAHPRAKLAILRQTAPVSPQGIIQTPHRLRTRIHHLAIVHAPRPGVSPGRPISLVSSIGLIGLIGLISPGRPTHQRSHLLAARRQRRDLRHHHRRLHGHYITHRRWLDHLATTQYLSRTQPPLICFPAHNCLCFCAHSLLSTCDPFNDCVCLLYMLSATTVTIRRRTAPRYAYTVYPPTRHQTH